MTLIDRRPHTKRTPHRRAGSGLPARAIHVPFLLALALLCSGCENQYNQRKAKMWMDDIHNMESELVGVEGMPKFVAHQRIIDRCKQVLDKNVLTGTDRAEVVKRYVDSSVVLNDNGDRAAADDLAQFCKSYMNDPDPSVRETCEMGMVEIEAQALFESQRIRNHIDELALLGKRADLGDKGPQFAELTGKFQTLWVDVEQNGADHSAELDKILTDLGELLPKIPLWIGGPKEVEIRYNQLATHFRDNSLAKEVDFTNLFREVEKMATRAPTNPAVAAKVASIANRLIATNLYAKTVEFGNLVAKSYANASDASLIAMRDRLNNQVAVCQSGIEQFIHDWIKNPDLINDEALARVQTSLDTLKTNNQLSDYTLERLTALLRTIEAAHNPQACAKAVSMLKETLGTDPNYGTQVLQLCQTAEQRLAMIGQKFVLPQAAADQATIREEDFAGKWLAVLFWSTAQHDSIEALDQFERAEEFIDFQRVKPARLALNVDDQLDGAKKLTAQLDYGWPILVPKELENGRNPYALQYGIQQTPYCVLVNPEGIVEMIGMGNTEAIYRLLAKPKQ